MNKVILQGRLTKDIEYREYGENKIAKGNLAVSREKKETDGSYKSDFINITAFGNNASLLKDYTKKGDRLLIDGKLQTSSYEKDGEKRISYEVIIDKFDFIEKREKDIDANLPYEKMHEQVNSLPF